MDAKHALAVTSGTAAMHLALAALGVGPGDEVITTPITWPATANVIVHVGATPVFADVRADDLNIDPEHAASLVTERTKALLPVHLAGQPADMDPLWALGIPVIEDAAHAVESRYRGRKIGGLSDATCFSLYATKNVAAGEGGIIATNRDDVAQAVDDLRVMRRGHGSRYDIPVPGYKANLSDVLAAIALVQMDKIERHTRDPAAPCRARTTPRSPSSTASSRSRATRRTCTRSTSTSSASTPSARARRATSISRRWRRRTSARASTSSRCTRSPRTASAIPDQPPLPVAEKAGDEILSLPLSPAHSDADVEDAIDALRRVHARFMG